VAGTGSLAAALDSEDRMDVQNPSGLELPDTSEESNRAPPTLGDRLLIRPAVKAPPAIGG
jgi:hypothetical protein